MILLRFYFHDVKKQLKTNIHINFLSEFGLGFAIDYDRNSKLLRDMGAVMLVKKLTFFWEFGNLNSSC